jgi:hypothetical protein
MLEQGANTNEKWQQSTVWGLFLEYLQKVPGPVAPAWWQAVELLIEFGAKRSVLISHAEMIPARRMNSALGTMSDDVDRSAKAAYKCLSSKSRIDAVAVLRALDGKDGKRLAKKLKDRPGKDDASLSTESLPQPAPAKQQKPKRSWKLKVNRSGRANEGQMSRKSAWNGDGNRPMMDGPAHMLLY